MRFMKAFIVFLILFSVGLCFAQEGGIPIEAVDVPVVPDLNLAAKILAWVIGVNLFLGGLAAALAKVKDLTSTQLDNKAYIIISIVTGFLSKLLDFASANTRPKAEPKKDEPLK